jgi:hypothetical protein
MNVDGAALLLQRQGRDPVKLGMSEAVAAGPADPQERIPLRPAAEADRFRRAAFGKRHRREAVFLELPGKKLHFSRRSCKPIAFILCKPQLRGSNPVGIFPQHPHGDPCRFQLIINRLLNGLPGELFSQPDPAGQFKNNFPVRPALCQRLNDLVLDTDQAVAQVGPVELGLFKWIMAMASRPS